jgi:hypothetical protein
VAGFEGSANFAVAANVVGVLVMAPDPVKSELRLILLTQ